MAHKPKIGNDFPVTMEVLKAKTKYIAEWTRSVIALSVVLLGILALLVTAAFSAQLLLQVWAIVAAPLGWIIGYYFRGNSSDDQNNDESAA
jgi:hypothetical protein